jgi:hypothetical protein
VTRGFAAAAPFAALVFGLASAGFILLILGGLAIEPSDGGPPPYLRLFGFFVYASGLGAASYDAATSSSRPSGLPLLARILVSASLAGGATYFVLFFAFAPWNTTALFLALPGLLAVPWVWRSVLSMRPAA